MNVLTVIVIPMLFLGAVVYLLNRFTNVFKSFNVQDQTPAQVEKPVENLRKPSAEKESKPAPVEKRPVRKHSTKKSNTNVDKKKGRPTTSKKASARKLTK